MKIAILSTIFSVSLIAASAQTRQGDWMIGGNFNFSSNKQGDAKLTHINVSPDAGYFFMDNVAIGALLSISSDKPNGGDATTTFEFAPFARGYFLPANNKVNVFGQGSFGVGSAKSGGSTEGFNEFSLMAGPALFLNPHTALEFALFYKSLGGKYYKDVDGNRWNSVGLNIGFQIHLGK